MLFTVYSYSLTTFVFVRERETRGNPATARGWLLVSLRPGSPRWRHRRPMGLDLWRMRASPAAAAPLPSSVPSRSDAYFDMSYTAPFRCCWQWRVSRKPSVDCARALQRSRMFALIVECPSGGARFESAPDGPFKGPAAPFFLFLRLCHTPCRIIETLGIWFNLPFCGDECFYVFTAGGIFSCTNVFTAGGNIFVYASKKSPFSGRITWACAFEAVRTENKMKIIFSVCDTTVM